MGLFIVGRMCVKLAGRDAGKHCVIVKEEGEGIVTIDGETRRRKCNVKHLEPLKQTLDVKAGASRADVVTAFKKAGYELEEHKAREKGERPRKQRRLKEKAPKVEAKAAAKPKATPAKEAEAEPAKEAPAQRTPIKSATTSEKPTAKPAPAKAPTKKSV